MASNSLAFPLSNHGAAMGAGDIDRIHSGGQERQGVNCGLVLTTMNKISRSSQNYERGTYPKSQVSFPCLIVKGVS